MFKNYQFLLISRKREFGHSLFIKNSFSSEHSHPIPHKVTQNFQKSEKMLTQIQQIQQKSQQGYEFLKSRKFEESKNLISNF